MKRTRRTPSELSDSVHHQLNMYALAASAAGVGMLALAQPAEAKIVYTPDHRHVLIKHPLGLDLNRDGFVDFHIPRYQGPFTTTYGDQYSGTGINASGRIPSNRIGGYAYPGPESFYWVASALKAGQVISSAMFTGSGISQAGFMALKVRPARGGGYHCGGPWKNARNRYLGVKFEINGKFHYGWARLNVFCNPNGNKGTGSRALLTGYAYETVPDKPIIAGKTKGPDVITLEPGSLGALAAGASRLHSGK